MARRRAASQRDEAAKARAVQFRQWMSARALLREAVVAIDAELAPLGCYLSLSDDTVSPSNLAAIEICLCIDGERCEILLDLTVTPDGRQMAQDVGGRNAPCRVALPPIQAVTRDDYCAVLMAYVGRAMEAGVERAIDVCRECGRRLAAPRWAVAGEE